MVASSRRLRKRSCTHAIILLFAIARLTTFRIQENTGSYVMAMELCNGGSLFDVIDSAQYAFGLDENQFKRVVSDVGE